jgi:hypothetical protein
MSGDSRTPGNDDPNQQQHCQRRIPCDDDPLKNVPTKNEPIHPASYHHEWYLVSRFAGPSPSIKRKPRAKPLDTIVVK